MASKPIEIPRIGDPAIVARLFGWGMLAVLFAFQINNILTVGFGFTPVASILAGAGDATAWVELGIYAAALGAAAAYVMRSVSTSLRWDAHKIHRFNVYLIRALFWAVFLVGIVDAAVAFMRVEKIFDAMLGEEAARVFGKARWVGPYIHMPLIVAGFVIAFFTRTLGFTWLALMVVVAELLIVISRFVFSYEQALMGDLVRYWYAALFLFASAYTLFEEGHVRVDVLYAGFGPTTRGFINAIGAIALGMSTCWVIIGIGFNGPRSIINSPVTNFEVSQTGSVGMFIKYQMAAFLGLFAITMLIQFVSYFFDAVADKRDEPGHRDITPAAH